MRKPTLDISAKASRVLKVILVGVLLIIVRIWHLAEVLYEDKVEEARKPQRKVVMEAAKRGTIRDRFNLPLAINKIQYQIGVVYSEFSQIPRISWDIDAQGKRVKRYKRKEYIRQLSQLLGEELGLDPNRVDDIIHAKAGPYYQIPYILKEDVTEQQYYRLNMLAKDWPGLYVQRVPKRYYPKGKIASDLIGYMGAMDRGKYDTIMQEIRTLREYIEAEEQGQFPELPVGVQSPNEVRKRLKDLEEHAYTVNDSIGKAGVESRFEELLRGFHGKKSYYSDARGNFLRELPGSRIPFSGQRLLLTISLELQEYAEQLLAKNEKIRQLRSSATGSNIRDPWIKGGAIVAMNPNNGELLALATFPRFDPNDFIEHRSRQGEIAKWFETESYLAEVWNQKRPLEREVFNIKTGMFETEEMPLTWKHYLELILPDDSSVREGLRNIANVKNAVLLQRNIERLLEISGQPHLYRLINLLYNEEEHIAYGSPPPAHIKAMMKENLVKHQQEKMELLDSLDQWFVGISHNYDKILLADLCRLAAPADQFDDELLDIIGHQSLGSYHDLSGAMIQLRTTVKAMIHELFHDLYFTPWRSRYGADFLKEKRREEKERNYYAKPYIDYFDQKEQELFKQFWETYQWRFLTLLLRGQEAIKEITPYDQHLLTWRKELEQGAHQGLPWSQAFRDVSNTIKEMPVGIAYTYLKSFRDFEELTKPLYGRYRYLRRQGKQQLEKHLAMAFYPLYGYGNARSFAYRQATTQGSLFKLVTSFGALIQRYHKLGEENPSVSKLNPLVIDDAPFKSKNKQYLGHFKGGNPIPQLYKGGRIMKTMVSNVGEIDLVKALEFSSNPYFSLLASDIIEKPMQLAEFAREFSYGSPTGVDLPYEIGGSVPNDIDFNRTGLYSMANGQHTLVVTPIQTACMLSAIANGGYVLKPNIIHLSAGNRPSRTQNFLQWQHDFPFKQNLSLVGVDFPLFQESSLQQQTVQRWMPHVNHQILMPKVIQNMLLEGMRRVVDRQTTKGLGALTQAYRSDPGAVQAFVDLKKEMVGKTGTAESMENLNLDLYRGTNKYNHVWFGGVSFDDELDSQGFLVRDQKGKPELVVVVFLRFGGFGKEVAPIAAQMIKKWREIKEKHAM